MQTHGIRTLAVALVALVVGAAAGAAGGCTTGGAPATGGGSVGDAAAPAAAPTFDLATLNGPRMTNQTFAGKPTLLTFSASW